MSRFENIVRPFQRPEVSYPVRIFDETAPNDVEDPVHEIGKEGSTKCFGESVTQQVSTYRDAKTKEKSRETEEKRITNPSDDSQFVDVELIKKLTTEQGKGKKYQKTDYEFNNT